MSDTNLKVTDRRMFTADGELREEYQKRQEDSVKEHRPASQPGPARPSRPGESRPSRPGESRPSRPGESRPSQPGASQPPLVQPPAPGPEKSGQIAPAAPPPSAPATNQPPGMQRAEARPDADEPGAPGFLDLIGLLAEPASIYLREASGADPQTAVQSLELARLHIDLLIVLQDKTRGNLSASEAAMLEDVVYQLRSGYVGLRG